MGEVICLKGVSFGRGFFHSATLVRPGEQADERYKGNLTLSLNFMIPFVGGHQAVLNNMFLKEATPIGTIDLYLELLRKVGVASCDLPNRANLIEELLTADEKALSKGAPISPDKAEIVQQPGAEV